MDDEVVDLPRSGERRTVNAHETLDRLAQALGKRRFRAQRELALQDAIGAVLAEEGILFEREHELSKADRPDFWVAPVAVEVKVGGSFAEVVAQFHRYAQHESVGGVLLVTSRIQHVGGLPETLSDKPLRAVHVGAFL